MSRWNDYIPSSVSVFVLTKIREILLDIIEHIFRGVCLKDDL